MVYLVLSEPIDNATFRLLERQAARDTNPRLPAFENRERVWLASILYHLGVELSLTRDVERIRGVYRAYQLMRELYDFGAVEGEPREGEWRDDGHECAE